MDTLILRMDDVGASSKSFEIYSKRFVGNFLFLKYYPPFAAWGPYPELDSRNWEKILKTLEKKESKMTVGITASWVEKDGKLIPFPKKFKKEAKVIKKGVRQGFLEVGNHGLTHCLIGKHLPRLFLSNRTYHREFYDFLGKEKHEEHIKRSQEILQDFFEIKVITFIPPGGVWNEFTEESAEKHGLKYLCGQKKRGKTSEKTNGMIYIADDSSFSFHDRDIFCKGQHWLEEKIQEYKDYKFVTVSDFAKKL